MGDKETIERLIGKLQRWQTLFYNAVTLGQLNERYSEEQLLTELGITKEEYKEAMEA